VISADALPDLSQISVSKSEIVIHTISVHPGDAKWGVLTPPKRCVPITGEITLDEAGRRWFAPLV
jgi:hypothetical protein